MESAPATLVGCKAVVHNRFRHGATNRFLTLFRGQTSVTTQRVSDKRKKKFMKMMYAVMHKGNIEKRTHRTSRPYY